MADWTAKSLGRGTLAVVLLSALPLGANRPMWWLLLAATVGLLFLAQTVRDLIQGLNRPAWLAMVPLSLLLVVLIWAGVQSFVPVGPGFAHPVWMLLEGSAGFISADPLEGRHHIIRLASYGMVFWLALRAASDSAFAGEALRTMAIAITVLSAYGLVAAITGNNPILGERPSGMVSASFVNRNNFATYAVIGLLANLAVYGQLMPEIASERPRQLRDFLEMFFSTGWLFATGCLICFVAILFSQSRAGLGAALVGIAVFALAGPQRSRRRSYPAVFVAMMIVFAILAFSSGTFSRVFVTANEEARFLIYPLVVEGIGDRLWLGHGLGAFQDAFRPYVSIELARREIDLAHSSYLETLFELGVPVAVAFYAALAVIVSTIFLGVKRRRRNHDFARFAFAVSIALGFHAFFDFSLQIPAIAALFAFVLGIGWAQAFPARTRN